MELKSSFDQLFVLVIRSDDLGVSRVGRQVHCQSHQFLAHNRLRTVDNQLINQGDTLSIGKSGFELIFLGQVIQQFEDQSTETRSFQYLNKFGNHTSFVDLLSDLGVKGQVEK